MSGDVTCTMTVAASPDVVARYFTDAELMLTWMGERAELDAVSGGRFAVDIRGTAVRGTYLDVSPNRIVFTWGFAGSAELPPCSSRVEVTLTEVAEGTRVDLVHSGLPGEERPKHRQGWHFFTAILRTVVSAS